MLVIATEPHTLQSGNFYMNDRLLTDKNKMLIYSNL